MKKIKNFLMVFFTIFILLLIGLAYYFIFTTNGSKVITQFLLSDYVETKTVDAKNTSGSLFNTFVCQDIEFHDLEWLPKGNSLKIQRLEISLTSFSPRGLSGKINNGRLQFPGSDAMLFYGDYQDGNLNITVYSSIMDVRDTLDLFAESALLENVSGIIRNVDMKITGYFLEPELNGTFYIERLDRDGFSMTNCPGTVRLKLNDIKDELKAYGQITLINGIVSGQKTAAINLLESKILFDGSLESPTFDFKGTSQVENVKIEIALKGTLEAPDLKISSKPPMTQERLVIMLATDKSWNSVEAALSKGELSVDLAKDFLDYFIFSGSGNKTMQQLGVRDVQIKYDNKSKGIGATKDITDKVSGSYSIEQPQGKQDQPSATQKLGGEYKINDAISIGAERELKPDNKTAETQNQQQPEDKVMLKFKKEF